MRNAPEHKAALVRLLYQLTPNPGTTPEVVERLASHLGQTYAALQPEAEGKGHTPITVREDRASFLAAATTAPLFEKSIVRHRGGTASKQAANYLQIFETLAARDDLPPGMFITGLMPALNLLTLVENVRTEALMARADGDAAGAADLEARAVKLLALGQMRGADLSAPISHEHRTQSFKSWLASANAAGGSIRQGTSGRSW